jgi:hypothetical protein
LHISEIEKSKKKDGKAGKSPAKAVTFKKLEKK